MAPGKCLGKISYKSAVVSIIRVKKRFDVNAQMTSKKIQVGLTHLTASVAELTQWNSLSVYVAAAQTQ